MAGTQTKRSNKMINASITVLFACFLVVARPLVYMIPGIESELLYISVAYYSLILVFLCIKYRLSARRCVYYLLLIFLSTHALRQFIATIGRVIIGQNPLGSINNEVDISLRILSICVYFGSICLTYHIIKSYRGTYREKSWKQILGLTVCIAPVMYLTNLGLIINFEQSSMPISAVFAGQISSYCGLVLVIGYDKVLMLNEKEQDIMRMEMMLLNQKEQYALKSETVDILNRRYHDFKNQILYLGAAESLDKKWAYLHEIEKDICQYELLYPTGNEVLDIVLTSKGAECEKAEVRLLLLMDGSLLNFMKPLSIVSLFGNAVDNALRALESVEKNRRELTIRTRENDDWIVLRFENEYVTPLKWQGNRLMSTKPNAGGGGACLVMGSGLFK
jgi:hypothetical protein